MSTTIQYIQQVGSRDEFKMGCNRRLVHMMITPRHRIEYMTVPVK